MNPRLERFLIPAAPFVFIYTPILYHQLVMNGYSGYAFLAHSRQRRKPAPAPRHRRRRISRHQPRRLIIR
jgi:hypothetical protein